MNNNIVLIDTFNRLKTSGMETTEAVLRTGAQRLRPVVLTSVTTVFGLLPLASNYSIDFINPHWQASLTSCAVVAIEWQASSFDLNL